MIRPFTCVCALLAGASGLYLYSEKHRTTLLDQQISRIVVDTEHTRERTAMLRAEWALLNQPDRLQGLATHFLPQLQAMAPTQFVQMASLDKRLPAPGPETPPHPIATPLSAPGLVGQPSRSAPDGDPTADRPAADTALAIAQAGDTAVDHPGAQQGLEAKTEIETASREGGRHAPAVPLSNEDANPGARPAQAAHADTLLADADASEIAPQAALHRVAAHAVNHEVAHHLVSKPAAPIRLAALDHDSGTHYRPAVTAISSSIRPQVIVAASWRPVHASWPTARPASYAGPTVGSSLGGSFDHASLPAPVPLSDGN